MRARVRATLYDPKMDKMYKIGDEVDVPAGIIFEHKDYFELLEKTAPAPENKMVTAAKEFVKAKTVAKKGKK